MLGFVFCLFHLCGMLSAQGKNLSSMDLREYCHLAGRDSLHLSGDEALHAGICLFYVSGVIDGYEISGVKPLLVCISTDSGVTNGQLALVVSKYLDDHPDRLNNAPVYLVLDALSEAFPCRAQPQRK